MRWSLMCLAVLGLTLLNACGRSDDRLSRWKDVSTAQVVAQAEPAEAGYVVFRRRQCNLCHADVANGVAPSHHGLWGSTVTLSDGSKMTADEAYIRESILNADAKIVAGYKGGQMANYKNILSAKEVDVLVAYIESLRDGDS